MNSHRTSYTFSLLRYVHDVFCGEFLNVGIVVRSTSGATEFRALSSFLRIAQAFPTAKLVSLKTQLSAFEHLLRDSKMPDASLKELLDIVLPEDDSSLQWSPFGSGVTFDLKETTDELFLRLVLKSDKYDDAGDLPVRERLTYGVRKVHQIALNQDRYDFDEEIDVRTGACA